MLTETSAAVASRVIVVHNKADLLQQQHPAVSDTIQKVFHIHRISCATGEGISGLENILADTVKDLLNPTGDGSSSAGQSTVGSTMITRERHRRHVKLCVGHLERFLSGRLPMDAAAEEIR